MRLRSVLLPILVGAAIASWQFTTAAAFPAASTASDMAGPVEAQEDPNATQAANDRHVQEILRALGAKASEPAQHAFKNIRLEWYRDIPAKQLLLVMDLGFSKALGVSCTHCHDVRDFSSDEKRPKRAAREMALMLRGISQVLERMEHLDAVPDERGINCMTCHRGKTSPRQAR